MKKSLFFIIITLFSAISLASAKKGVPIVIGSQQIEKIEQSVRATWTIQSTRTNRCGYKLVVQPSIVNGERDLALPEVVFRTTKGRILDFRHSVAYPQNTIVTDKGETVEYSTVFPYKSWMDNSQLHIRVQQDGCSKDTKVYIILAAENLNLPPDTAYIVKPKFAYIPTPVVKHNTQWAAIQFPLASSTLIDNMSDNLAQLNSIKTELNTEKGTIKGIELIGASSPEGSYNFNAQLSKNRAASVQEYILKNYPDAKPLVRVTSVAVNWAGLIAALEENTHGWAHDVIEIASSNMSDAQKNRRIENLNHGQTFEYMLRNIYPALRSVNYQLNYTTSTADNQDILNTNNATYQTENGNTRAAVNYLKMVKTRSMYYYNTLGVVQMLDGDYQSAAENIISAAQMGLPEAVQNLEQLKLKLQNSEVINSEM